MIASFRAGIVWLCCCSPKVQVVSVTFTLCFGTWAQALVALKEGGVTWGMSKSFQATNRPDSSLKECLHLMCGIDCIVGPTENTKWNKAKSQFFHLFRASSHVFSHLCSRKYYSNTFVGKRTHLETSAVNRWLQCGCSVGRRCSKAAESGRKIITSLPLNVSELLGRGGILKDVK